MSTATLQLVMLIGGLVGVVVCAKIFLNGAVGAAQRFGIPEFIVGSIIVAIGTSAPELAINVAASLQSAGDVIASNIVGSNIVNLGLGIGIAGLLVSYDCPSKAYVKAAIIGLVGTVFLLIVTLTSGPSPEVAMFTRTISVILFTGFVCFTIWSLRNSDDDGADDDDMSCVSKSMMVIVPCLIVGAVGMSFFADVTITNAVGVATALGIPDVVIGATIIAAGGSLPEVISCIEAARMKRSPWSSLRGATPVERPAWSADCTDRNATRRRSQSSIGQIFALSQRTFANINDMFDCVSVNPARAAALLL